MHALLLGAAAGSLFTTDSVAVPQSSLAQPALIDGDAVIPYNLEELRSRLAARESEVDSILIAYESQEHLPSGSRDCPVHSRGYWYRDDKIIGASVLYGCETEKPVWELTTWNGIRAESSRMLGCWDDYDHIVNVLPLETSLHTKSRSSGLGVLARLASPANLGLFYAGQPWSVYLPRFYELRCIGRSSVLGRDCVLLLGDMRRHTEGTEPEFPWVITIDDLDSLLVLRTEAFIPPERDSERVSPEARRLLLKGREMRRVMYCEVSEIGVVQNAVAYPRIVRCGVGSTIDHFEEVTVDAAASHVNHAPPVAFKKSHVPDGTLVSDLIIGAEYSAGHEENPEYSRNRQVFNELGQIESGLAQQWARRTQFMDGISEADADSISVYYAAWIAGASPTMNEVSVLLGRREDRGADEEARVASIRRALAGCGIVSIPIDLQRAEQIPSGQTVMAVSSVPGRNSPRIVITRIDQRGYVACRPMRSVTVTSHLPDDANEGAELFQLSFTGVGRRQWEWSYTATSGVVLLLACVAGAGLLIGLIAKSRWRIPRDQMN